MEYLVISDFDATITTEDVVTKILDEIGSKSWREQEDKAKLGLQSLRECVRWELDQIKLEQSEFNSLVDKLAKVSDGFVEFSRKIYDYQYPFFILSDGLTEIIERVIDNATINVHPTIYSHRLKWRNNRSMHSILAPHVCDHGCALCKKNMIQQIKHSYPDYIVIYIGDGLTDKMIIEEADLIFARSGHFLSNYLHIKGIEHFEFDTFRDIVARFDTFSKFSISEALGEQNDSSSMIGA